MSDKIRILFVDDDRYVLDGLRRMLYNHRKKWKMEFVTSASEAFSVMESSRYDMVISDLKMPDIDGVTFLEKVRELYPSTIRFMLSGYADQPLRSRAARCVHQMIPKPCDADTLAGLITRAIELHGRLKFSPSGKVISELRSLPVMPKIYQQVINLLHLPDCSLREIGKLIACDIGMSSKILHVANSGFYGSNHEIVDPIRAVVYLGLKTVEALILTAGIFSKLPEKLIRKFNIGGLQEHCGRVGMLARAMCEERMMGEEELEIATMAGILHDTGKMILIASCPDAYEQAILDSRREQRDLYEYEKNLHVTHTDLGGCLLELWGLPNAIIETAAYHHDPTLSIGPEFNINTAVYAANILDHQLCSSPGDGLHQLVNLNFFEQLGLESFLVKYKPVLLSRYMKECAHAG